MDKITDGFMVDFSSTPELNFKSQIVKADWD